LQGVVNTSDGKVVRAFHKFTLVDQSGEDAVLLHSNRDASAQQQGCICATTGMHLHNNRDASAQQQGCICMTEVHLNDRGDPPRGIFLNSMGRFDAM